MGVDWLQTSETRMFFKHPELNIQVVTPPSQTYFQHHLTEDKAWDKQI